MGVYKERGVMPRTQDRYTLYWFSLAVVQLVLLYGPYTCVITPRIGRVLGRLYHRVDHMLTGMKPHRGRVEVWLYHLLEDTMVESGLQEVENYVSPCHNTVSKFITTRPIMDLCLAAERRTGPRVSKRW